MKISKRITTLAVAVVCLVLQLAVFTSAANKEVWKNYDIDFPNFQRKVDIISQKKQTSEKYCSISLTGGTVNSLRVMPRLSNNSDAGKEWRTIYQGDTTMKIPVDNVQISTGTTVKLVGFQRNVRAMRGTGSATVM